MKKKNASKIMIREKGKQMNKDMKNGYYLSAYVEIDQLGNIYRFAHRHDQSIALWKVQENKVELIHYWELERLSGVKKHQYCFYDKNQFYDLMNHLLGPFGLSTDDIIEVWGTPELGDSESYMSLGRYPEFSYHTMCHLSSCLFMDTNIYHNEKILGFSVDGGSDIVSDTEAYKRFPFVGCLTDYKNGQFALESVCSPAILWDYMSSHFTMREGSLMALASASKSTAYYDMEDILLNSNIKVEENVYNKILDLIEFVDNLTQEDEGVKFNYFDPRFSEHENRISMVMKIIEEMSKHIMEHNIEFFIEKYGIDTKEVYLAVAGGFALNCPCNTHLMNKYQFKGFIAPPCVSDSGMALGIGLYVFYDRMNGEFDFALQDAYWGDQNDLSKFQKEDYSQFIKSVNEFDPKQAAMDIIEHPIVWIENGAEIGPRALGSRSLLGDPRKMETKDVLNHIKKRQWWRPVAPIVIKDKISEWFEDEFESPFMLHASKIREDKDKEVIAIVHEDRTARLQSIDKNTRQKKIYQVMESFNEITGVPIICNTSLNDKGEPIINNIDQAINFALRKNIPIMYIDGKRFELMNHQSYDKKFPLKRNISLKMWEDKDEYEQLVKKFNPNELSVRALFYYIHLKINDIDLLQDKRECKKLEIKSMMYFNGLSPFSKAELSRLFNDNMYYKQLEEEFNA
ncbi:carbamoyltransferase C-terminal domain-containing protein [Vallitalea guaymasensis]|uniref:carbamoyltransferase C-terminal domain-containing protein n=1 Tax=Vallitalea guaymasensis TaxID=1185412 RepID=UPI00272A66E6|nr:carbamoyltransferase C-terminal domain-containing protein [Vallitalea guaymasensis]